MPRGVDTSHHPGRKVDRESLIGRQVHMAEVGQFTVTGQDKRYVTGVTAEGEPVGRTGIGLLNPERLA